MKLNFFGRHPLKYVNNQNCLTVWISRDVAGSIKGVFSVFFKSLLIRNPLWGQFFQRVSMGIFLVENWLLNFPALLSSFSSEWALGCKQSKILSDDNNDVFYWCKTIVGVSSKKVIILLMLQSSFNWSWLYQLPLLYIGTN